MVSEKTGRLPNIFLDRRLGLKPRSTQIAREFWGFWDSLAICGFTRRLCAQLRHSRKIFPTKSLCNPFSTCLEPSGDTIPSFYRLISSVCGFARESKRIQENYWILLHSLAILLQTALSDQSWRQGFPKSFRSAIAGVHADATDRF